MEDEGGCLTGGTQGSTIKKREDKIKVVLVNEIYCI